MVANSELAEIIASTESAVHRAYALGRSEALREVVGMLQDKPACHDAPALLPSPEPAAPAAPEPTPPRQDRSRVADKTARPAVPWYLRNR